MGHKQSRRLLECINGNSLIQVTEESSSWLNLVLTNKEELWGVKVGGALGTTQWWHEGFWEEVTGQIAASQP